MKKKLISIILVGAMTLTGILTGCAGAGSGSSRRGAMNARNESTEEEDISTKSISNDSGGQKEEISFWNIATDEPNRTLFKWVVDKYNSEDSPKSGYAIEQLSTVNDDYKEKLAEAMDAGKCPDMYTHWTGGPMVEYVKSGNAVDLTELVDKYGLRNLYTEASLAQASVDGKIYAIPTKSNTAAVFFYNKAVWAERGYVIPETIGELETLCDRMVSDGITPFALANQPQWTGSMYYMYLVARHGGPEIVSKAYDGSGSFINNSTKYAGDKIREWVEKGYFPEDVNTLSPDNRDDRALLYRGAGMMLQGSWQVSNIKSENPDFYANLGCFAFPALEGSSVDQTTVVGSMGDQFVSFSCTGEKLEEAFKMATYFSCDEWMQLDIEKGNVPPLRAASSDEPAWQDILAILNKAKTVQLWWDQYLPTSVADVHKTSTQKLFDLSASSEEVAKEQQDAMDEYLSK